MSGDKAIARRIRSLVSSITRLEPSELDEDVKFREELGVDSLMAMEIVATCEKEFGIQMSDDALLRIETLGEFMTLVEGLCSGPAE